MHKLTRAGNLRLILVARRDAGEVLGALAAPPHLPTDLWRWPGETEAAFYHRVLGATLGEGVVRVVLVYRADFAHGMPSRLVH